MSQPTATRSFIPTRGCFPRSTSPRASNAFALDNVVGMTMRTTVLTLGAFLFAGALVAQQNPPQPPDYSRPTLLRILADQPEQQERKVEYPFGAIQIEGRSTRW